MRPVTAPRRRSGLAVVVLSAFVAFCLLVSTPASATTGGTISGTVFLDANRDGVRQADETPYANRQINLYDGAFTRQIATAVSDSSGRYAFTGLPNGDYRVEYDAAAWLPLRTDWVPTTTGTLWPRILVQLTGPATADFGLRPIVRSSDLSSPLSAYTGANGLRVESFNDALDAREVYDDLASGSLIGPEAATVTVRLDYQSMTFTATSGCGAQGDVSGFRATIWLSYLSWADTGDETLFHEYGHDWSEYHACLQQDSGFARYLAARGLTGDPRLGASKVWDPAELIAEDYRQLFGTTHARSWPQANTELAAAADVPGLRDFLATTYTTPPSMPTPEPPPEPPPAPAPPPALAVSNLAITPTPVKTEGTTSFSLSTDASVTVQILNSRGALVRTLLSGAAASAGEVEALWNRKNSKGQRVKAGTYTVSVRVSDAFGQSASLTKDFKVA